MYYGEVLSCADTEGGIQVEVDIQAVVELHANGEQQSAPMRAIALWQVPARVSGPVVVFCADRGRVVGVAEVRLPQPEV